jgi:chitin synthase
MLIYAVPILFYICLFGNMHIMCEIILGAFSFLFYTPTYLNILNIYSLCRIDDISWGTKGLDSGSGKNAHLKGGWKLLKFIHVAKYVIWNILLASVLLTLGSSYTARFFVTIGMVILIGMSMSVKVFVGVLYMIYYRCKSLSFRSKKPNASVHSSIAVTIDKYSTEIRDEVETHLYNMKEEYTKNQGGSFIQAKYSKAIVK